MSKLPRVDAPRTRVIVARHRPDETVEGLALELDQILSDVGRECEPTPQWMAHDDALEPQPWDGVAKLAELLDLWELPSDADDLPTDPTHMVRLVAMAGTVVHAELKVRLYDVAGERGAPRADAPSLFLEIFLPEWGTDAPAEEPAPTSVTPQRALAILIEATEPAWGSLEPPAWTARAPVGSLGHHVGAVTFVAAPRVLDVPPHLRHESDARGTQLWIDAQPDGHWLSEHVEAGKMALLGGGHRGTPTDSSSRVSSIPSSEPAAPAPSAPPETRIGRLEPNYHLGQTAPLRGERQREALPFSGKGERPRPAATSLEPNAQLGETSSLDGATPSDALPFSETLPLTLEQYASLTAELVVPGAHQPTVLERYGLSSQAELSRVETAFRKRFSRDQAELQRFLRLVSGYQAWLASNR